MNDKQSAKTILEVEELAEFALNRKCDGLSVDAMVCACSPQLVDTATCINVKLSSLQNVVEMSKPAATVYAVREDQNSYVAFAFYPHSDSCPVSRTYYFYVPYEQLRAACQIFLWNRLEIKSIASPAEFEALIEGKGAASRILAWKDTHTTSRHKLVEELAQGRCENTFIGQTIYLSSETCLVCKRLAVRLMSSNIGGGDDGISLMFGLCDEHANEAFSEGFILDFLTKKFGLQMPWSIKQIDPKTDEAYFKDAINIVTGLLGCTLDKSPNKEAREITGLRPSGFKVIIRIQSDKKRGYAYMVLDPKGNNVERIDDAPDHPDLRFQSDHRHIALPLENKSAEPSFTFGHPIFDTKAILAIIERAENVYKATGK